MIEKDVNLNVNNIIGVASSLLGESTTESVEYMQSTESIGKLKEQNLFHRTCTARSLAFLLPNITAASFRRRSPMEIQLFVRWRDIVGADIAAQTRLKKLSAKTLTVACSGPIALEMHYRAEMIMARINKWSGNVLVERIRIVQESIKTSAGTLSDGRQTYVSSHARRSPLLTDSECLLPFFPKGHLREALESLGSAMKNKNCRKLD